MDKKSFVMYDNWATLLANLPTEQAGDLIKAICSRKIGKEYETEDPVVLAMIAMILPQMEEDELKYQEKCDRLRENRRAQETNQDRKKTNQSRNETNQDRKKTNQSHFSGDTDNDTDNDTVTDTENDTENDTAPTEKGVSKAENSPKGGKNTKGECKRAHGEQGKVRLTDTEYKKLVDRFGEEGAEKRIEALDLYIASKNSRYSSHYATILNWERRDQKDAAEKSRVKNYAQAQEDAWFEQIRDWADGDGTAGTVSSGAFT